MSPIWTAANQSIILNSFFEKSALVIIHMCCFSSKQWLNAQRKAQVFTICSKRASDCIVRSARAVGSEGKYYYLLLFAFLWITIQTSLNFLFFYGSNLLTEFNSVPISVCALITCCMQKYI